MRKEIDYLIDSGNSYLKIASLHNNEIQSIHRISKNEIDAIKKLIDGKNVVFSNVGVDQIYESIKEVCSSIYVLDSSCNFPFRSNYKTKKTWGIDRACNIAAAHYLYPKRNILVIDIGTCLKFDFIDDTSTYQGGSISPGIRLRFSALNSYTAKLPIIEPNQEFSLIGKSTNTSILNGVMKGFELEILGFIEKYQEHYNDLLILITGGDLNYFDFNNKCNIFAVENLTLVGLNQLFLFNEG